MQVEFFGTHAPRSHRNVRTSWCWWLVLHSEKTAPLAMSSHTSHLAQSHRQRRLRTIEGLNLALLVDTQDQGMLEWVQVKAECRDSAWRRACPLFAYACVATVKTFCTPSATSSMSVSDSVGWTRNISAVSPSSFATGNLEDGRIGCVKAFSR